MSFPTANDIQLPMRHGHWTSTKALRADRQGSFGDTVQTDHKPLERIFGLKTAILLLASSDAILESLANPARVTNKKLTNILPGQNPQPL